MVITYVYVYVRVRVRARAVPDTRTFTQTSWKAALLSTVGWRWGALWSNRNVCAFRLWASAIWNRTVWHVDNKFSEEHSVSTILLLWKYGQVPECSPCKFAQMFGFFMQHCFETDVPVGTRWYTLDNVNCMFLQFERQFVHRTTEFCTWQYKGVAILTFMCPCIVTIIRNWRPTRCNFFGLFICTQSALHVSGDVFTHHQEHLTVFTTSDTVHQCCCRPVSWTTSNSTWNISEALNTIKCSWWWAKKIARNMYGWLGTNK